MNTFIILFILIVFGIFLYIYMEKQKHEIKNEIQSIKTNNMIQQPQTHQPEPQTHQPEPQTLQPIIIQQPQPIIPYTYIVEPHDHGYHPRRFWRGHLH